MKNFLIDIISLKDLKNREEEVRKKYLKDFEFIFRLNVPQSENSFQNKVISKFKDEDLYSVEYKT